MKNLGRMVHGKVKFCLIRAQIVIQEPKNAVFAHLSTIIRWFISKFD